MDNQTDLPEKDTITTPEIPEEPIDAPAQADLAPIIEQEELRSESPAEGADPTEDAPTELADPVEEEAAIPAAESETALPPAEKKVRGYKGATLFFALFFFVLTIGCFTIYALAGGTFLHNLLVTMKDKSVEETVAGIFGTILALPFMLIFGIAQFVTNIPATLLLKRVAGKADARWKNILFGIFYGISIFTFVALFLLAGGVVLAAIRS